MYENGEPRVERSRRRRFVSTAGVASLVIAGSLAVATIPNGAQGAVGRPVAAHAQNPTQQVKALQGQVKALLAQVKALQQRVSDLEDYNSCESVVPLGRFGDASSEESFGYKFYENGDGFLTTAVDYVDPSDFNDTYDDWFVIADASCVDTSARVPLGRPIAR
jgi:hypothetical protein